MEHVGQFSCVFKDNWQLNRFQVDLLKILEDELEIKECIWIEENFCPFRPPLLQFPAFLRAIFTIWEGPIRKVDIKRFCLAPLQPTSWLMAAPIWHNNRDTSEEFRVWRCHIRCRRRFCRRCIGTPFSRSSPISGTRSSSFKMIHFWGDLAERWAFKGVNNQSSPEHGAVVILHPTDVAYLFVVVKREQVVIGTSQMRRHDQSDSTDLAFGRQFTVLVVADWTKISAVHEAAFVGLQMTWKIKCRSIESKLIFGHSDLGLSNIIYHMHMDASSGLQILCWGNPILISVCEPAS